jgi:hypothetical protein
MLTFAPGCAGATAAPFAVALFAPLLEVGAAIAASAFDDVAAAALLPPACSPVPLHPEMTSAMARMSETSNLFFFITFIKNLYLPSRV